MSSNGGKSISMGVNSKPFVIISKFLSQDMYNVLSSYLFILYNNLKFFLLKTPSAVYTLCPNLTSTFGTSNFAYDPSTGKLQKDIVSVLKFNTKPTDSTSLDVDYTWEIIGTTLESDAYTSSKAVKITFADSNDDGVVDNPEEFNNIVNDTYVFFEKYITDSYTEDYRYIKNKIGRAHV